MKIHLNRAGQSLGQFTPEEIRAGFREGKFVGTDLAWRDGMASWQPLSEVIDEIAPETEESGVPPLLAAAGGLPWERRAEVGFFSALFETIRLVLLEPKAAFATMKQTGGLGAPLFFFVLLSTVGVLAGIIYQTIFDSLQSGASPEERGVAATLTSPVAIGLIIVILPILVTLGAFVAAGFLHLALIIVGGAKRPFEATFRVVCYAGGATAVLQLLPICGTIVASVWHLVCVVIGLSEVHGIGQWRAAVAVFLPSIVCCALLLAGVVALVAAFGGMAELMKAAAESQP
ncbi:MAG: YIP1 family protein [Verrucomicrobia bacterium]|jgi:hypothetical protein|nr:YIP1 family protein [Verrucomicrobiota bacterium]